MPKSLENFAQQTLMLWRMETGSREQGAGEEKLLIIAQCPITNEIYYFLQTLRRS